MVCGCCVWVGQIAQFSGIKTSGDYIKNDVSSNNDYGSNFKQNKMWQKNLNKKVLQKAKQNDSSVKNLEESFITWNDMKILSVSWLFLLLS